MSELGQFLKRAREEKKISLDELQEMTKIQKRYIEAIEEGKYQLLPGSFYTRAFIRNIAENLNLDTDLLLKQYEDELPATSHEILETVPRRRRQKISGPSMLGPWLTRIILVAFVALIISIVYMFIVKNYPPVDKPEAEENQAEVVDHLPKEKPTENTTPTTPEQPKQEEVTPEVPKPTLTYQKVDGKTYYYQISMVKQMQVQLVTSRGRCWYQLEQGKGGTIIESGLIEKENVKTWDLTGLSNVYIRLGATKDVDLLINGVGIDTTALPDGSRFDITLVPLTE